MLRMIQLTLGVLIIASLAATPASADFYFRLPNGDYLVVPEVLVLAGLFILAAAIAASINLTKGASSSNSLPAEIDAPEPPEYYEDQAVRARALKRMLDAETDLTESYLKGKRVRAELDEIEDILELDKAKRQRRR